jgi:hypothetical protein
MKKTLYRFSNSALIPVFILVIALMLQIFLVKKDEILERNKNQVISILVKL